MGNKEECHFRAYVITCKILLFLFKFEASVINLVCGSILMLFGLDLQHHYHICMVTVYFILKYWVETPNLQVINPPTYLSSPTTKSIEHCKSTQCIKHHVPSHETREHRFCTTRWIGLMLLGHINTNNNFDQFNMG